MLFKVYKSYFSASFKIIKRCKEYSKIFFFNFIITQILMLTKARNDVIG